MCFLECTVIVGMVRNVKGNSVLFASLYEQICISDVAVLPSSGTKKQRSQTFTWQWGLLGVKSGRDADNQALIFNHWHFWGPEAKYDLDSSNLRVLSFISDKLDTWRIPCGGNGITSTQHQDFIRPLVLWIEGKHKLPGCCDLNRGMKESDRCRFVRLPSPVLYLDPEPFGHNLDTPVWIQLLANKTQVAGPVCHPGDH